MAEFYVKVGDVAKFSKTVGEYDVYGFAGISGEVSGGLVIPPQTPASTRAHPYWATRCDIP